MLPALSEEQLLLLRQGRIVNLSREQWNNAMADREPILVEREKTHGSFADVSNTAQSLKLVMFGLNGNIHTNYYELHRCQREALDMIATKIARILQGNAKEKDHWKDIAGYAKLGEEACE